MTKYEYRIFEIDVRLAKLFDEAVDPETGEFRLDPAALEELQIERDELCEEFALEIKNRLAFAAAVKSEADALKDKYDSVIASAEKLKATLMEKLNGDTMKTPRVTVSYRHSEATEIDDEAFYADESNAKYWRVKTITVADKNAVKAAIKAGESVAGAKTVEHISMLIK